METTITVNAEQINFLILAVQGLGINNTTAPYLELLYNAEVQLTK